MDEQRPDPDELLERLRDDEARASRGRLKIFFGSSAGVGKTYAMLNAARQQLMAGVDTVIGVVETHGRPETEAMADGIERLPAREIVYRDRLLKEFDLDAALQRKPALILMDELAHSNVPGSRHPKRWHDIEELLAAGIDVYSTVNVQHLESLNDVVGGITGIRIRETVPDSVFDKADEVVLVDLPPDELVQRLHEGKVYLPQQAKRAIRNFFRKGNLLALRELALRRTADRVDLQMLQYRQERAALPVWQTRDSLLACVGPGGGAERLVRTTALIAKRLEAPWHVIYVETPNLANLSPGLREAVLQTLKLAEELGAEAATLTGHTAVDSIIRYAREHNLGRIVVGRDHPRRWRPWYRSFADRLGQRAPDLDVIQVARDSHSRTKAEPEESLEEKLKPWHASTRAWVETMVACALAAGIGHLMHSTVDLTNIAMLFLLAVVLVAVRHGRGPAVLASLLGVAAFDFLFVPPRLSLAVSDVQYLVTFAVMLAVGLITGQLTAGLRYQAYVATRREERMRALYQMSRDLSAALLAEQIADIARRFVDTALNARMTLLLTDSKGRLQPAHYGQDKQPAVDLAIAQWTFDHREAAGLGTDTLPATPVLYQPLLAPMRIRGVMALVPRTPQRLLIPEQRRLLDTVSRLVAIALERIHYVEVAQSTLVQMESERLRNALLAALSHDLRTPLTSLIKSADRLAQGSSALDADDRETAALIREQAQRLSALVENLLDMERLQAGLVRLNKQWQAIEEAIDAALRQIEPQLGRRQVSIGQSPGLPLLEFDAVLIERVLYNLLENACKYTPADSRIDIVVTVGDDEAEIAVGDSGPGLPSGAEESIFEKFTRGKKESSVSGVGLGLAICRAIIEAHGGRIYAKNRAGGGAIFTFTLPLGNPPDLESDRDGMP